MALWKRLISVLRKLWKGKTKTRRKKRKFRRKARRPIKRSSKKSRRTPRQSRWKKLKIRKKAKPKPLATALRASLAKKSVSSAAVPPQKPQDNGVLGLSHRLLRIFSMITSPRMQLRQAKQDRRLLSSFWRRWACPPLRQAQDKLRLYITSQRRRLRQARPSQTQLS